jgi:hypothetical protein
MNLQSQKRNMGMGEGAAQAALQHLLLPAWQVMCF